MSAEITNARESSIAGTSTKTLAPPTLKNRLRVERTTILPLPAGEGRGEGEPPNHWQASVSLMMSRQQIAAGGVLLGMAAVSLHAEAQEVDTLIAQIQSQDAKVRGAAWQGAATAGSRAVKPLAALLTHLDFEVARSAKRAVWKIVRHAGRPKAETERKAVQAELVALLDSATAAVRREAIWMLSEIGDASTIQKIARLLDQMEVREDARCALERMPGANAVRALERALKSAPEDFRPALANSLRVRGHKLADYPSQKLQPSRKTSVAAKN